MLSATIDPNHDKGHINVYVSYGRLIANDKLKDAEYGDPASGSGQWPLLW